MAAPPTVARSLAAAYAARATVTALLLPASPDLVCATLMCASLGGGCACRLALTLSRLEALEELDVSGNALPALPDAAFEPRALRRVAAARNALAALPRALRGAAALEELDVRDNRLAALPLEDLAALPRLRRVRAAGNPLTPAARGAATALLGARLELE